MKEKEKETFKIGSGSVTFYIDGSYSFDYGDLTPEQTINVDQVFSCYHKRFYTRKNVVDELRKILGVKA